MRNSQSVLVLENGVKLAYAEWGRGEPVLFLHGLADYGGVWQGVAERLNGVRCIAPDLRGHGESSKADVDGYDSGAIALDLEQFCTQLKLNQISVVAHSWAAKIALIWAKQQPQRLRQLALVDPFFVNRFSPIWKISFPLLYRTLPFLKVMGPFESWEAAVETAKGLKQYQGWSDLQQNVFAGSMTQTDAETWVSKFSQEARDGVFLDTVRTAGLTEVLPVPTTLFLPEQGLNKSGLQLKPYRKYLKNLTIEQIPGNHWPHLVTVETFGDAISTFLATS